MKNKKQLILLQNFGISKTHANPINCVTIKSADFIKHSHYSNEELEEEDYVKDVYFSIIEVKKKIFDDICVKIQFFIYFYYFV